MKALNLPLLAGVAVLLTASAQAQTAAPLYHSVPLALDSGEVANTGSQPEVIISFPVQMAGSTWLRLYFDEVTLAGDVWEGNGAILRLTSWLDGDVQELNSRHVDQWQRSSAYLNGDTVQVEVLAYPGTGVSRVKLRAVDAGIPGQQESQCGPTDDRILSSDPRAGRLLPIGCTGWLIDDCQGCALTAGHCTSNISVLQFNVPLSDANGSLNNPPAADQYAVDSSSLITNGGQGVGNDWGYFGTFPNSTTGLTAAQAQGSVFTVGVPPAVTTGNDIRITGYGVDNTPSTHNQVQQTNVGPLVNNTGTQIGYVTDTTGGNSGSPVIHEQTGDAVGIHTHGGCSSGNNWGTQSTHPDLQNALANPLGICSDGGINLEATPPNPIAPGTTSAVRMSVFGSPIAGTQTLFFRASSALTFSSILMTDLGSGLYEGALPAFACGDEPEYYITAQDAGCGLLSLPPNAPVDFYTLGVGTEVVTFSDNFESDLAWGTSVFGASAGAWERGVPIDDGGNAFDPASDGDGSGSCYLTQNTPGESDVDNGEVRLTSPLLDFTGGNRGLLYTYFLNLSNDDGSDTMQVEVNSIGGVGTWTTVALHDVSKGLAWTSVVITESELTGLGVTLTNTMRVRFRVTDAGAASTVEAGVDAVKVGEIVCNGGGIGTTYCSPAVNNSTGTDGKMAASGSDVAAANNLTLSAGDLPANQFGFFLNSLTQAFTPNAGGSQGTLCLGGQIGRYNMPPQSSGAGGSFSLLLDLPNTPIPTGTTSILAGETWHFQAWYRDLNPASTSNFTTGLSITFQ
jgi:V8-like Glu-specific endopeptidase